MGMLQTLQVVSTAINYWISPPISEEHLRNHGKLRMHQKKEGIKTIIFSLTPPNQVRSQLVISLEMCIISSTSHDTTI